jgi:minor extracellular serine protease Vpr
VNRGQFAVFAALTLVVMIMPAGVTAKDPPSRFQRPDLGAAGINFKGMKFTPAMVQQNWPIQVIAEVAGKPVALHQRDALAKGKSLTKAEKAVIRAQIKASQDKIAKQIKGLGAKVLAGYQDAYNGIRVDTTPKQAAKIAALPGVVAIHTIPMYAAPRPNNVLTTPYVGGPAVWGDTGFTGAGVKIGIIDTGIDYYHIGLGGSGDPDDFANANRTSLSDGGFPNAKVGGGYDFAGDAYTGFNTPSPDPDPLDCDHNAETVGHGTHVAGTAAGGGVLADGTAYSGPYDAATISSHTWRVGPGVAPQATLYGYRVFGCQGSTNVVVDAINRAVLDGVDVINMSLGAPFSGGDLNNPDIVASNNAALAGIVVVASSGNGGADNIIGPSPSFITGSPGTADRVLSVAALDAVPGSPAASIELDSGPVTAINANNAALPVTGELNVFEDDPTTPTDPDTGAGGENLGCDTFSYVYNNFQPGQIAVVRRGACARIQKPQTGQAVGAAAVVMINNQPGMPPFEGDIEGVTIPFLGVSSDADPFIAADGDTVTISAAGTMPNAGYNAIASFSSGGPRNFDNAPKPDVAAPGVSVSSLSAGTGTHGQNLSGTSMAAPATAGVAALVTQAHPTWTTEQIKAAIMNTANGAMPDYSVRRAGAGAVAARRAVDTVGLAVTESGRSSLAFGYEPSNGAYVETLPITIRNTGASSITYNLSSSFSSDPLGASVSLTPSSVSVPAGGSATVKVKIQMSANSLSIPEQDIGTGSVLTVEGAVVATPTSAAPGRYALRVPFSVSPRGLSAAAPGKMSKYKLNGGVASATIPVTNSGIHATNLDVYAWGLSDPNDAGSSAKDVRAVGVQAFPFDETENWVIFAINTHGRWGTGASDEIDIAIDVDENGEPDYYVIGFDAGRLFTGFESGEEISIIVDADFNIIDLWIASSPANGSTMLLPAVATFDLGLEPGNSSFDYTVAAFDLIGGTGGDEVSGVGHFDAFAPALSQGDYIRLNRGGGSTTLPLSVNKARFATDPALGWMLVALDDANGAAQADLVSVGTLP